MHRDSVTVGQVLTRYRTDQFVKYTSFVKSLQELGGSLKKSIEDVYNLMKQRQQSTAYMEQCITRGKLSRFFCF